MTEVTLDTLAQRLSRLERELKRWRVAVSVLGIVALITFAGAAVATPDKLRARECVVIDTKGKEIAALWAFGDMPTLTLQDKDGKPRAQFDLLPDGSPRLYFADANQRIRLRLGANTEGRSHLEVINHGGKVIWEAP